MANPVEKKAEKMEKQQQQSLASIQELQKLEKDLYAKLQTDSVSGKGNLDGDLKTIDRINKLSKTRTSLYNQMGQTYGALTKNVASNRNDLVNQTALVKMVEEELNKTKKGLQNKDDAKYNKLRMIEINTYEANRLNANKKVVMGLIYICIGLIVLTVLYNKKIVSGDISKYLFVAIIVGGFLYLGSIIMDISKRDNMNFDEYEFKFDAAAAKAALDAKNKNKGMNGGGCVNNNCCADGTLWSSENHKCMPFDETTSKEFKPPKFSLKTAGKAGSAGNAEGFTTTGHETIKKMN